MLSWLLHTNDALGNFPIGLHTWIALTNFTSQNFANHKILPSTLKQTTSQNIQILCKSFGW